MAERIRIDHGSFESARQKIEHWRIPQTVKDDLYRFLDDLSLGKVNRGKRISPRRQLKYLHALKAPLEFFDKPTNHLTIRDIEHFEQALGLGQLANHFTGKPFAHSTQVDMRILLKIFLRWRLGTAKAEALAGWLDTRSRPKTPDYLKEAEVERLYKHCRNARQRFLVATLFDGGARAEEFHNLRFDDVSMPEGRDNFVKITLKQEYSKTLGRTIALYWKYSLEAFREYLAERIAEGIKPDEPVFRGDYDATRKMLQRLGQRVLHRSIHYHLFRHSSATHFATKLNRQELCYRYGWKFSSNMPDVYISRAGMESKQLDEKFTQTELGVVKDELARVQEANRLKDDRLQQMENSLQSLQRNLDAVSQVLSLNPSQSELRKAMARKTNRS